MGGKSSGEQTTTSRQILDPSVRRGVDFLTNQAIGLGGGGFGGPFGTTQAPPQFGGFNFGAFPPGGRGPVSGPITTDGADLPSLVPGLGPDTQQGLELLRSQFTNNPAADVLGRTVEGEFQDLSGITQAISDAAIRSVGDRFSQAGRTGGPGEGLAIAGEVSRNLAPFAFAARESGLDRQQRAIPALLGLQGQEAQNFLNVGQTLEEQQRLQALEPFQRLQLIQGPLATAISGAPPTQQISQPTSRNALAGGLGGALAGSQALSLIPGIGTGVGAGLGGLIGLLGL